MRSGKYRWTALGACLAFAARVMAGTADGDHVTQQINGSTVINIPITGGTPVAAAPSVTQESPVQVTATVPGTSTGFLLTPTGRGFTGRAYAVANPRITPSNISTNNPTLTCPVGDPVLPATGTKVETYPLFALPGEMGLRYILYYNSNGPRPQGASWTDNLSYNLDSLCQRHAADDGYCGQTTLYRPDGSSVIFNGGPTATSYPALSGVATLSRDPSSGNYTLHDEDATTQVYTSSGSLLSIKDASGIGWTIGNNGTTKIITHTSGQSFTVQQQLISNAPVKFVTTITDPAGNIYTFQNASLTYPGTPATTVAFKYDSTTGNLSEVDYNGVPYSYTTYDTNLYIPTTKIKNQQYGWATGTYLAGGMQSTIIAYNFDNTGRKAATITNPLGYQSTQTFDANGNLTQIAGNAVQTCGATVSGRAYDGNGHLAAEIDNNGNTHAYTYAANGQLQTETEAYGTPQARTTTYVWDANVTLNRPLSITVAGVKKTVYSYNAQNRVASVSVTNLSGNGQYGQTFTTTYAYTLYGNGMVQSMAVTRPGSGTTTAQYDAYGNLTSETNGLGQTTTYAYYNGLGQPGRVAGPNGDVTSYTYDARGRLATKVTYPNGSPVTWTYGYDGFGLLASQSGPDGQVTTWTRDPSTMWVSAITHNDKDGTSTESFSYDANGDVLQHTVARGGAVSLREVFHYDALGRVYQKVGQSGQTLTYAYDGNGNPLSVTDAVGHTIVYQYDALNRVTQQSESGGASLPIPAAVGSINVPSAVWLPTGSVTNPYTVSWNSVPYASYYVLQEQADDGSWVTVQSGSSISWSAAGKARGNYRYRVAACDVTGCSAWSPAGTFAVNGPNPELPAVIQLITGSP